VEGQVVIATHTTENRVTESLIKPTEISGSGEGLTTCPFPDPEISFGFIGVSVTQSLVVYVAITACPSPEPEISVGFTTEISGSGEGKVVIATYTTKD
jgi:hypothetical protein